MMNVKNLYYPEVKVGFSKTDEFSPEVKVENGIIWVETTDGNGKKSLTRADALMSQARANATALDYLLNSVWSIAFGKMDMSKAELKRLFIKRGLISK